MKLFYWLRCLAGLMLVFRVLIVKSFFKKLDNMTQVFLEIMNSNTLDAMNQN